MRTEGPSSVPVHLARAVTALVLVVGGVSGCGSDKSADSGTTASGPAAGRDGKAKVPAGDDRTGEAKVEITIQDNVFSPANITVSPGTTVVWKNAGRNTHNVMAEPKGAFPSSDHDMANGAVHTVTFDKAGVFVYFCSIHGSPTRGQHGSITVVDG